MTAPTPLPEVNAVLAELVTRWREILGSNLVGAYLQGSFAVGDFTETSDIDFLVVIASEIEAPVLARLQRMHAEINAKPSYWAKHLEGSYAVAAVIRRLTDEPGEPAGELPRPPFWRDPGTGLPARYYPFFFLNNGSDTLLRSEHDNSRVVRWVVREHGIVLHGPPPAELIDRITGDELRAEMRTNLVVYVEPYAAGQRAIDAIWLQAFFVTLICRMLHTLDIGEIHSKKAGTAWALRTLDPQWHGLIARAAETWAKAQARWMSQPDASEVESTIRFMHYALKRCATGATLGSS
jgi:predicted nucleotidyltransferase